jgi:hypothetical protein
MKLCSGWLCWSPNGVISVVVPSMWKANMVLPQQLQLGLLPLNWIPMMIMIIT